MTVKMKKSYMVEFRIPQPVDSEFRSLLPLQQKNVCRLMLQGSIISYTLSEDRTRLWSVMAGENRDAIDELIDKLPLSRYMRVRVNDLTFHGEAQSWKMPALSLN